GVPRAPPSPRFHALPARGLRRATPASATLARWRFARFTGETAGFPRAPPSHRFHALPAWWLRRAKPASAEEGAPRSLHEATVWLRVGEACLRRGGAWAGTLRCCFTIRRWRLHTLSAYPLGGGLRGRRSSRCGRG